MKQLSRFLPVIMAFMLIFARMDKKGSFDISVDDGMKHGGRPTLVG